MNNDYFWNLDDEYLAHHGRLGQKWGVMHGPPYPLSRNPRLTKYLNDDGSLSSKTLKKGKRLGKKLERIDRHSNDIDKNDRRARRALKRSGPVKAFYKDEKPLRKEIKKSNKRVRLAKSRINRNFKKDVKKKYMDTKVPEDPRLAFSELGENVREYLDRVNWDKELNAANEAHDALEDRYKDETNKFLRSYLGDSVPEYYFDRYTDLITG